MSVADEFKTVDLVLASGTNTLGVDAFALSLIKAEKQVRRLVTYLMYQHPWCSQTTKAALRDALEKEKVYFDGLVKGWDALYPQSVQQLVGAEYARLWASLATARQHRNKIFHGQLTSQGLSTNQLVAFVSDIRLWCGTLGSSAQREVGYDGCGRNSFRKASNAAALVAKYKMPMANVAAYQQFIKMHMAR